MKTITIILACLITLDIFGAVTWAISGQVPADTFYLGSVSTSIIRMIII